jgi:TfoX/Sxy family transcriptional regulator of competence genes
MPSDDPAPAGEGAAVLFCRQQRQALKCDPAISEKKMFGTTVLCARGKVFLFPWRGTVVVKIPAGQADELVASGAATLFDPGHGRTSRTWVAVLASASDRWPDLARDARAFVAG